jgi:AcrR family transcriptional regulator
MREQADTRTRIQEIALELFTEQGYEATSLREIAERLGVTKAALYYHFKTKEDIVGSMIEDRVGGLQRLITWAQGQPRTLETRREFLRRYSGELHTSGHHNVMRFLERNQTALRDHPDSERMRDLMFDIIDLLVDKDEPLTARIKATMSIFALHATWFVIREPEITDDQRRVAALEVAIDMLDSSVPASTG